MLRWLLVVVIVLVLFNGLRSWLEKLGLGRLPGDLHFKLGGREWHLPIATTVLLSFLAMLVGELF